MVTNKDHESFVVVGHLAKPQQLAENAYFYRPAGSHADFVADWRRSLDRAKSINDIPSSYPLEEPHIRKPDQWDREKRTWVYGE